MSLNILTNDLHLADQKVFLRADLNLPMKNGNPQDLTRLQEIKPTVDFLINQNAKIALSSHFGRPTTAKESKYSLSQLVDTISQVLQVKVVFVPDILAPNIPELLEGLQSREILLLENSRFYAEEETNDDQFSKKLALPFDIYVNDAFGACHRAHATTAGIAKFLPSYAGFLMQSELDNMTPFLSNSLKKPFTLLLGGAKIDTKIGILKNFIGKADYILIGGALANTFLLAQGFPVGLSLTEPNKLQTALEILELSQAHSTQILIPTDLVVAKEISPSAQAENKSPQAVNDDDYILDIGQQTTLAYQEILTRSHTVIANGPMGLYETPQFANGTKTLLTTLAGLTEASVVIGGGDSLDALKLFQIPTDKFTHISTGGGAMIEFLEGKTLPGLKPLIKSDSA